MGNIAGVVLYLILKNPENALAEFSNLKHQYFNTEYHQIFSAITLFYDKHGNIPSFETLKLTNREQTLLGKISALELLEVSEDIDLLIAVEVLRDQYTQDLVLDELDTFVDILPTLDSNDTKLKLSEVLQTVEEQTESSEEVFLMNDLLLFNEEEMLSRVMLGLNNTFDAASGGMGLTELLMLGGSRGSGKTVVACNIAINQYKSNNSCLVFSIEMRAREIFSRFLSILSGVPNNNIRLGRCTKDELVKLAKTRSDMFINSSGLYDEFLTHSDYKKFEAELISTKTLKSNQIITVDNQALTIADIDMNISKFKLLHGDKLKTVIVDYVNQIQIKDIYDWKSQIMLSKKLKDLAVKHNVLMVTPYQIDSSGEARFAKGLLDAADIAVTLTNDAANSCINFKSTKTRGIQAFEFNAPCIWDTLQILPNDAIIHEDSEEPSDSSKPTEKAEDVTWSE